MATIPDKPSLDGLEARWSERWSTDGTYRFDRTAERDDVFAIDTPPPTVSGSLHVGHVFSYTHTDTVARFQRMRGKAVFYPIGWDDNGLATERRVQNYYGVRCDPSLPYEPGLQPPFRGDPPKNHHAVPISRPNFIELCDELTAIDEQIFEDVLRRLGLSYDWDYLYTTIHGDARRASQRAFLRNLARGEAYTQEAPTLWDVDFKTAVAQAEMEDKETAGAYHQLAFHRTDGGGDIVIDTTRPELVPACVALVAHPDDERYQPLFGAVDVSTPLFGVEVPIVAHPLADPEKGTGIAMICTFGDVTDVTWWRELRLPTRAIVGRDGRLVADAPWITSPEGAARYAELAGSTTKQALRRIVELLAESGELRGDPRPIVHPVKFYERGDRPLEIVTSRQWYIRNGGREADLRAEMIKRGDELTWHPAHMQHRFDNWIEGLNGDWLISRQRFFGVPIPVWYRLDEHGEPDHDHPLVPDEHRLPIDPSTDVPDGYRADQRGEPGGFIGDPDVMDTWATSSLTPQIAGRWEDDPDLFSRVFPMDVRPQGHDIIRTWLFATVVRSHYEHDCAPWKHAALSGWILDPDRKKMSKSKGNVVTPMGLFDQYGTDAVRYWSASARPGVDTAFSEEQMKVGRKLATKLLNVSKFVLGVGIESGPLDAAAVTDPIDRSMLAQLDGVVADATIAFDAFDYARALERTEAFFWWFCDDYVELVKSRAYATRGAAATASARAALAIALDTLQRLFAPILPFATEEVWSWWRDTSIHRSSWPTPTDLGGDATVLDVVCQVLFHIRRAKTEAKVSQRAAVAEAAVAGPPALLAAFELGRDDLAEAGSVATWRTSAAAELSCSVALAPPPDAH
jgi:valyl-tRNA synthetase